MVFDPFGINGCGRRIDADCQQELINRLVPLPAFIGQFLAFRLEFDGLIRCGFYQAFFLNSLNDPIHRNMADAEMPGQVCNSTDPFGLNDLGDGLDIVFGCLRSVIFSRPAMGFRILIALVIQRSLRWSIRGTQVRGEKDLKGQTETTRA